MSSSRSSLVRLLASHPVHFSRLGIGIPLRPYQQEVADAVIKSVLGRLGLSFVIIFPRQSGKNEAQAHIQAYLLYLFSEQEVEIVSVSPTYKPQALNAMLRLQRCLDRNPFTRGRWQTRAGFTVCLGKSSVHFFSGNSVAHTVGATASALLSVDEAQDIRLSTYDRKFAPMVASANATRVFWGTPWTSSTLLAREKRHAESGQQKDGIRRLWTLTADDVALFHPLYGDFVSAEVARFGRSHPYIRTQYFSEEIDSQGSMFNPTRLALMQPDQPPQQSPSPFPSFEMGTGRGGIRAAHRTRRVSPEGDKLPQAEGASSPHRQSQRLESLESAVSAACAADGRGGVYAFLLDVAGQDEARMDYGDEDVPLENPSRDSASLSIVSIDLSTLAILKAPTYRVVHRLQWVGSSHLTIFGQLKSLVESWRPQHIVIDATGVGEGLWALLDKEFPARVIPVKFSRQVKSELGWKFLSIIDTGRFRDLAGNDLARLQYTACRSEVLPGPGKLLRWGVPEGARGPDGQLIHDDILLADSLVGILDSLEWHSHTELTSTEGFDPLVGIPGYVFYEKFSF